MLVLVAVTVAGMVLSVLLAPEARNVALTHAAGADTDPSVAAR